MLLHTISSSPWHGEAFASCMRAALPGSVILLIEDGVYAAAASGDGAHALTALTDIRCFALEADVMARGLQQRLAGNIDLANYDDFVRLSTECHAVQSWY